MKRAIIAFGVFASLFLSLCVPSGCYYDNEEDLYGVVACDTSSLSYKNDIAPILNSYCYTCHVPNSGQAGATPFNTYNDLKPLTGSVTLRVDDPVSPMPPTTAVPLPDCERQKIKAWIKSGALDN